MSNIVERKIYMNKKRLVLKPWAEKVLGCIFAISFVLMVCVNDFNGIGGLLAWLLIIATTVISGGLLKKYGTTFRD